VLHLVPKGHAEMIRGDRACGERAFAALYRHRTYRDLWPELSATLAERLSHVLPLPLGEGWGEGAADSAENGMNSVLRNGCETDELIFHAGFAARKNHLPQDAVVIGDVYQNDAYSVAHLPLPREIVVDIGAHIGCFAASWRRRNPAAKIVCVEACAENLAALRANVGAFADVVHAACTYEPASVALLNAVWPGCVSTGGSRVVPAHELSEQATEKAGQTEWWHDARPLPKLTLEELMSRYQFDHIDVLKLDCEGSEFSILEHATCLDRIGLIVGEYHGSARFRALVAERFSTWTCHLGSPDPYGNDGGPFWLFNRSGAGNQEAGVRIRESEDVDVAQPFSATSNLQFSISNLQFSIPSSAAADFWTRFFSIVHPIDQPFPDAWRQYYLTLFDLAAQLRPKRICEIGARAGYSAFTMLSANPSAFMLGIEADLDETVCDTHGGRKGLCRHAEKILAPFNYQLLIADSHSLVELPRCDLVYIDGDHTLEGCLGDLRLAERSTDTILVDNYDLIPSVREACERFAAESPGFETRYIPNGLTGMLLLQAHSVSVPLAQATETVTLRDHLYPFF
jgi:FkbM family methyltransferase